VPALEKVDAMGKRIFLSYTRDDENEAIHLCNQLGAIGHDVWIDRSDLPVGHEWWQEILKQLRLADVVILVISQRYIEREACTAEWTYAWRLNKTLIPVAVEKIDHNDLPRQIYELQVARKQDILGINKTIVEAPSLPLPIPLPEDPPPPLSWPKVREVVHSDLSTDPDTQFAVAIKLVENLWAPSSDAPPDVAELATNLLHRRDLGRRARRLVEAATRASLFSWDMVRETVNNQGPIPGHTQVAVAVKLIEYMWAPSSDAPKDIAKLAVDFRGREDLDTRVRRLLQTALPPPRAWFPVAGAVLAGLALTHLFWVTGLYELLNSVLGKSKGPITVNLFLAVVGVVLCVAALGNKVKGALLGLVLCAVGILFTVIDAIKIGWLDLGPVTDVVRAVF
jgi:hypothetical protein